MKYAQEGGVNDLAPTYPFTLGKNGAIFSDYRACKMNKDQQRWLADGVKNLGNIAIAALLFGQLISDRHIRIWLVILGIAVLIACYGSGFYFLQGGDKDGT